MGTAYCFSPNVSATSQSQSRLGLGRKGLVYITVNMLYKYTPSRGFMCVYLRRRLGHILRTVQQGQGVWGMDSGRPIEPFLLEARIPSGEGAIFGGRSKHDDVRPTSIRRVPSQQVSTSARCRVDVVCSSARRRLLWYFCQRLLKSNDAYSSYKLQLKMWGGLFYETQCTLYNIYRNSSLTVH